MSMFWALLSSSFLPSTNTEDNGDNDDNSTATRADGLNSTRKVIVMSIGAETFEKDPSYRPFLDEINKHYEGDSNNLDFGYPYGRELKRTIARSLYHYFPWLEGKKVVLINCHKLRDPDKVKELRSHVGLNPRIQAQILDYADSDERADRILNRITDEAILGVSTSPGYGFDLGYPLSPDGTRVSKEKLEENTTEVVLLTVCRRGKHRSVGMAELIAGALRQFGFPETDTYHSERGDQ